MTQDKFRIDSHKLMFHPKRVSDWLAGKNTAPIYMEASPAGACNHRCAFCGLDFMEYKPRFLDADLFGQALDEMGGMGLKSIMYAGEGEPLLHKDFAAIVERTAKAGIDSALTTNGVLLNENKANDILPYMSWIKVSFNAGSPETYAKVHGTQPEDFDKALANLKRAAEIRAERNLSCTLGMQALLLPENEHEMERLAKTVRDIGLDYLVIKPYSQHPKSNTTEYDSISYDKTEGLGERLRKLSTDTFNVIYRENTMRRWDAADKGYPRCYGLPFWSYVDAGGNVWGCSVHLTDDRFLYGNIYDQTFGEIWEGEKRRKSLEWVEREMDASDCRVNCRLDEINRYLWDLKNPGPHVNFI